MNHSHCQTSACRYCRHFIPEGRRGGNCQQLGVTVQGRWKACSLALPAFAPSWEGLEGLGIWQHQLVISPESRASELPVLDPTSGKESHPHLILVADDHNQDLALA